MTEQVSPLRRRMIDDMTIRNMTPGTQKVYVCKPKWLVILVSNGDLVGLLSKIHDARVEHGADHLGPCDSGLLACAGISSGYDMPVRDKIKLTAAITPNESGSPSDNLAVGR